MMEFSYTRMDAMPLTDENAGLVIAEYANRRISDKLSYGKTLVILNGDGGSHRMEMQPQDERDSSDMALFTWFMVFSCNARSMLSVTEIFGRKQDDPPQVSRKYLIVSVCIKEDENVRCYASMTEMPTDKNTLDHVEESRPLPSDAVEAAGDGPSLYSLPRAMPTLKERVEARGRVASALKRADKNKRLFTEAMHTKIGW